MVRYRTRLVRSRIIYALLLLGALCASGFAACLAVDRYPRLEKAFVVGAGASFLAALLMLLVLLLTGGLPWWDFDLAGGVFAYKPKGSPARAGLIGVAVLFMVFVCEVLPRWMGVEVELLMHIIVAVSVAVFGYLAYVEFRGKPEDKE